jgi:TBC1 domain family member 10
LLAILNPPTNTHDWQTTFWSLVQVMKTVKGLFSSGLPLYNLCLDLFGQLCRKHLPTISGHLERQRTMMVMFAGQWFNTLFANGVVPIDLMHRIWDLFLFYGMPVIFQVALALLKAGEGIGRCRWWLYVA